MIHQIFTYLTQYSANSPYYVIIRADMPQIEIKTDTLGPTPERPTNKKSENQTVQGKDFRLTVPKYYEILQGHIRFDCSIDVEIDEKDPLNQGNKKVSVYHSFAADGEVGMQNAHKYTSTVWRSGTFHHLIDIAHPPKDASNIIICLEFESQKISAEVKAAQEVETIHTPLLAAYTDLITAKISKEAEEDSALTLLQRALTKIRKEQKNNTLQQTHLEKLRSKIIPGIEILLGAYISLEPEEEQERIRAAIEYVREDQEYRKSIFSRLYDYLDITLPNSFLHEYASDFLSNHFNRTFGLATESQRKNLYIMVEVLKYAIDEQLHEIHEAEKSSANLEILTDYDKQQVS